jgi:hypothetical protein
MKEEHIDKFDLERIINAVEDELTVEEVERGEYDVTSHKDDGDDTYRVNLKKLMCSCPDYKYNCEAKTVDGEDTKMCKHLYRAMFEVHGIL